MPIVFSKFRRVRVPAAKIVTATIVFPEMVGKWRAAVCGIAVLDMLASNRIDIGGLRIIPSDIPMTAKSYFGIDPEQRRFLHKRPRAEENENAPSQDYRR